MLEIILALILVALVWLIYVISRWVEVLQLVREGNHLLVQGHTHLLRRYNELMDEVIRAQKAASDEQ